MADDTRPATPRPGATASTSAGATSAAFVALKSGLVIRQYVIEEVIGAGGFGITYRARHERLTSKIFALKEFFPREFAARSGTHVISTRDGEGIFRWGLNRFLKEAEALAKCQHPGIVDVIDYFEQNGTAYAVLGYVEGLQLGQWLDGLGRPPTQAELDRIFMPLLDALEVVHGANLLHRDIAPDNILIRRDGSPCLIDFGACREDIRERSQKISAIVKHGYSPPEQYHGIAELQGPWTDIYAVGATLYRAVSGALPMDSSRRSALGDGLKPLGEMEKHDYRPGFMSAIDKALRLKPEERPQSISTWRSMLTAEALPARQGEEKGPKDQQDRSDRATAAATSEKSRSDSDFASLENDKPRSARQSAAIIATIAAIALAGIGALALWRPPLQNGPGPGPVLVRDPAREPKVAVVPPPANKAESEATQAWERIHVSGDRAVIEGFLATHGASKVADAARARLTELAAAERQRQRDAAWAACQNAANADKVATCNRVADSDDTAERRAVALQIRGNAERAANNYDKAIADFTRSLELSPDKPQVLTDRGVALFLKGGTSGRQAALSDYEAAIRVDPRHAEALNNRAWAIFQAGRTAEALVDANRSIEASATNGYAYDTRGQILEALGRREDAIRDYERAIQIDPSQATSRVALQRLNGTRK